MLFLKSLVLVTETKSVTICNRQKYVCKLIIIFEHFKDLGFILISGNLDELVHQVDHLFCETTQVLHEQFENCSTLKDVLLRFVLDSSKWINRQISYCTSPTLSLQTSGLKLRPKLLFNSYWMRLSIIWRIIEIDARGGCCPPRLCLLDLDNSLDDTKIEFNNCFIIHSKIIPSLKTS